MEEFNPVVTEKNKCDFRDFSILVAFFGNLGPSGLWRKAQIHFFDGVLWHIQQVSGCDLHEIIEPFISGEKSYHLKEFQY